MKPHKLTSFLLSVPLQLLVFISALYCSYSFPVFSKQFHFIGKFSVMILNIALIPLIFILIADSIPSFRQLKSKKILKLIFIFLLSYLITSLVAALAVFIMRPTSSLTHDIIASFQKTPDASLYKTIPLKAPVDYSINFKSFGNIIESILPENLLATLVENHVVKFLITALIFGMSLAFIEKKYRSIMSVFLHNFHALFTRMYHFFLPLLPLILFTLLSNVLVKMEWDTLFILPPLLITFFIAFISIIAGSVFLISQRLKKSLWETFKHLCFPFYIGFATGNTLMPLPILTETLKKQFKLEAARVDFLMPLITILGHHIFAMVYTITILFIAHVFHADVPLYDYVLILLFSIFASFTTIGNVVGAGLMSHVIYALEPLSLPVSGPFEIFILIYPLLHLFSVGTTVFVNTCILTFSLPKK